MSDDAAGRPDRPLLHRRHCAQIHGGETRVHIRRIVGRGCCETGGRLQQKLAESLSINIPDWRSQPDAPAERIQYGEQPVYRAMNSILKSVVPGYKYTSLDELNALLHLYSIRAYRGRPDSALYAHEGLIYQVLGANGKPAGSAIKASDFDSQPTLFDLRRRFGQNESLREAHRRRLTVAIDWVLDGAGLSMDAFRKALEADQISTVLKKERNGDPGNIWYIDHATRTVFEGQALGARYSAGGIAQRCVSNEAYQERQVQRQAEEQQLKQSIRGLR